MWTGRAELNRYLLLGRQGHYRYATPGGMDGLTSASELVRFTVIETVSLPWQGSVMPLDQNRVLVRTVGLEPTMNCV